MKNKKILFSAIGAAALISLVGCSIPGMGSILDNDEGGAGFEVSNLSPDDPVTPAPDTLPDPDETPDPVTAPDPEPEPDPEPASEPIVLRETSYVEPEFSDDIYSYQISVDGFVYQLPCPYTVFANNGLICKDEDEMVPAGRTAIGYYTEKEGLKLSTQMTNFDINQIPVSDCYVTYVSLYSFDNKGDFEVKLPGDVVLGKTTYSEVVALFGEPSYYYESDSTKSIKYEGNNSYNKIAMSFDIEDGEKLSKVEVEMIDKPEDFVASELDTSVPEIVSKYVAPTSLNDEVLDYIVEYDGDLYQLPCPIQQMVDNGWVLSNPDEIVEGSMFGYAQLSRNNQNIKVMIDNYDMNATTMANCYVTNLKSSVNQTDLPMTIAGISRGMKEADLVAYLESHGFSTDFEDGHSYHYYEITDEGANDGVELYVYKDTGTVDTLEVQYSPKVKDYRKEMGFND